MPKFHTAKVQSHGGSSSVASSVDTLGDLSNVNDDVDTTAVDGQVLTWNEGAFVTVATDSFDRADNASLGTTDGVGTYTWLDTTGDLQIVSNKCHATSDAISEIELGTADHAVEVSEASGSYAQIRARCVPSVSTQIVWQWNDTGLEAQLVTFVVGVQNVRATYTPVARAALRLEVNGDSVTGYIGGVARATYTITDPELRTGTRVGIGGAAGADLNNFQADIITGEWLAETPAATGTAGRDGRPGMDGEDADFLQIPGAPGQPGTNGTNGRDGLTIPGMPGEDADDILIPGPPGNPGGTGSTGAAGRDGLTIPGLPGDDADDPLVVPGLRGADGVSGSGTTTAFTKDLGVCYRSGTFDVTGLSGLTADRSYDVRMSGAAITTKGNARDESEMDTIVCTAYALNTTDLRVYWYADSVMVGTYAFVSVT